MGKKTKFSGFETDYANMTVDDQLKKSQEIEEMLNSIGGAKPAPPVKDEEKFKKSPARLTVHTIDSYPNQEPLRIDPSVKSTNQKSDVKSIGGLMGGLEENEEEEETGLAKILSEKLSERTEKTVPLFTPNESSCKVLGIQIHSDSPTETEEDDDEDETIEDIVEENEPKTLDEAFPVLILDDETGDQVINDPWKTFKSHVLSTFGLLKAKCDYTSEDYKACRSFVEVAIAIIAGPVLVVRQGNQLFKSFVNQLVKMDNTKVFVMSYTEDGVTANGEPVVDFLVYYIDDTTKTGIQQFLDQAELEENSIALDYINEVLTKATSRFENPYVDFEYLSGLIEDTESSDDDIEYFLNLLQDEDDTVLGDGGIDYFLETFVMDFKEIIKAFKHYANVLNYYFTVYREDHKDEETMELPENFLTIHKVENTATKKEETKVEVEVNASTITQVSEDEKGEDNMNVILVSNGSDEKIAETLGIPIDEADDMDFDIDVPQEPVKEETEMEEKIEYASSHEGIQRLGSKPHNGPLIIKRN
jgi:hypothetical protein